MSEEASPAPAGRKVEVYGASSTMRAEKDLRLIAAVRAHRSLYDNAHPRYMDYNHKLNVWKKVGEELKANPTACKTRWNNIRDNYRKSLLRRRPSQSNHRTRNKYKYEDELAFMTKFLRATFDTDDDDEGLDDDEDDEDDEKRAADRMALEYPAKDYNSDEQQESMVDYEFFEKKEAVSSFPVHPASVHAVDAFLAGISPTLKAMSPYHLGLAKAEIFATVHKYEMKGIESAGWKDANPLP